MTWLVVTSGTCRELAQALSLDVASGNAISPNLSNSPFAVTPKVNTGFQIVADNAVQSSVPRPGRQRTPELA